MVVPLIIRKRSLDAFQHAHGRHGRVGVLVGSANTAWHGLYMPNMGLFDNFSCIRAHGRTEAGPSSPSTRHQPATAASSSAGVPRTRVGGVGELATTDEFIIKQASSTSIMSIASEKTASFEPTVQL